MVDRFRATSETTVPGKLAVIREQRMKDRIAAISPLGTKMFPIVRNKALIHIGDDYRKKEREDNVLPLKGTRILIPPSTIS